jgi:hypothetical protein
MWIHHGYFSPHLKTALPNVENTSFAPALLEEVDVLLSKYRSRHSELHINNAAEFVSMESLLGDTPQHHHPPSGGRRLLYLGIGDPSAGNRR